MRIIVFSCRGTIKLTVLVWNERLPDGRDEAHARLEECGFTHFRGNVWKNAAGTRATIMPVTVAANMQQQLAEHRLLG